MGLKEKRLINVVKDENIPSHKEYAKANFGFDVEFDLNWDEWTDNYDAVLNLNGYVLDQAMQALYFVGRDAEGKDAIQDGVKTIKVVHLQDSGQKSMTLGSGVLTLSVAPAAGWDGVFHNNDIKTYLTDNL